MAYALHATARAAPQPSAATLQIRAIRAYAIRTYGDAIFSLFVSYAAPSERADFLRRK